LTYGSFTHGERDAIEFSQIYRMSPNEAHQYPAIIRLLLHFQWTWVGLLIVDNDSGENFLKTLEPLMLRNGICLATIGRIQKQTRWDTVKDLYALLSDIYPTLTDSKAKIVVLYGEAVTFSIINSLVFMGAYVYDKNALVGKVLIMTGQADITLSGFQKGFGHDWFQGAICFTIHSLDVPGFQKFLHNITLTWKEENGFLEYFWEQAFDCSFQHDQKPMEANGACTGKKQLKDITAPFFEMHMTGHSYSIYDAVYAVAHAMHAMSPGLSNHRGTVSRKGTDPQDLPPWQVKSPGLS
ncbi:UNVERIFIED_CONTAM: hypothetical protein K2H54_044111, partial [Gekko kuhli]